MSCISVNNLSFSYAQNSHSVLEKINFYIDDKESVGIIGANGVGKSTLLKLLVGLLDGYEGEILVDDMILEKKNIVKIRQKLGYVFQDSDSQLFLNTVYEDIAFGPRNYGHSEKEVDKMVQNAMRQTRIENLSDRKIYQLSGGEKKLVSIATILSMGVDTILFDEPSVALDPVNRENLIDVINGLSSTKIIASHDLDFIYETCRRTIIVWQGKIVVDGDTKEILNNKELLEKYDLRLPLSRQK